MDLTKEEFRGIYSTNPHKVCNPKHIKKHYPNIYKEIDSLIADDFKTKLYMYLNDIQDVPNCIVCGKPVRFKGTQIGFAAYCSCKCAANSQNTMKLRKQTCMERYGVPNTSIVTRDKVKQTMVERYGVEYALQNKEIYKKFEQTCLERYGAKMPSTLDSIQEKVEKTCKERYGGRWNRSEVIKEKTKTTNIERYGVACAAQVDEVKKKMRATQEERYGGIGFGSDIIRQKAKQTLRERYGVEHPLSNPNLAQKASDSQLKKYKKEHDFLIDRTSQKWICKCPHPKCNRCAEKQYETTCVIYHDRARCSAEQCTILNPIGHNNQGTNVEVTVRDILNESEVQYITNIWNVILKQELDIYIPSLKLAIECNGSYWHSSAWKDQYYHINKYIKCREQGIILITIWEDDIKNHPDDCTNLLKYHLGIHNNFPEYFDRTLIDNGLVQGEIEPILVEHDGYQCWTGRQKKSLNQDSLL